MSGRLPVEPLQIPVAAAAADDVADFVAGIVAFGCVGDELR